MYLCLFHLSYKKLNVSEAYDILFWVKDCYFLSTPWNKQESEDPITKAKQNPRFLQSQNLGDILLVLSILTPPRQRGRVEGWNCWEMLGVSCATLVNSCSRSFSLFLSSKNLKRRSFSSISGYGIPTSGFSSSHPLTSGMGKNEFSCFWSFYRVE